MIELDIMVIPPKLREGKTIYIILFLSYHHLIVQNHKCKVHVNRKRKIKLLGASTITNDIS